MQSVKKLKETELVEYQSEGDGELSSTEYGDIMSRVSCTLFLITYNADFESSSTFGNRRFVI